MSIPIKHRSFMVTITLMVFIITSILPGAAQANPAGSKTNGVFASGSLLAEKQEQGGVTRTVSADFSDIKNHPDEATIQALRAIGLVSGLPDGSFRPDTPVSQMEAITLVMRLAGTANEKVSSPINNEELKNIPAWGKTAAQKAFQMGIISSNQFQAAAPATRVRVMVWLAEAAGIEKEEAGSLNFKDSQLILPADAGYIEALYNRSIIKDTPQGNFEPNGVITRAQLATILKNILDKNLASNSVAGADKELVSLDILTVNDFHGALTEDDKNPGAAKLGKWLKDEKATNPEGTLLLSAGDMSQGSIDSNLLYGKTVIKAMNEIGFDAMAVGNHEFDWGLDCLRDQASWAEFPILTANITDKKTGHNLEGTKPWIIVERKGVKIGIIGVTTIEAVDKVSPKVISACKIDEPAETVNRLVPELKQQGAQAIIVLGHLGGYLDDDKTTITGEVTELANAITGVDVLVTGHTHQKMADYINGIAVVQAYYNARTVGHIALKYSPQAKTVVSVIPSVIDLPTPGLTEDARVKAIINDGQKEIGPVKNEIIGKTLGDLSHQRDKVSVLGQWVTDIMRQETNADIAFQNGGGLRTSIPAGEVTVGKLWEVIPFDNTLFLLDMKGSQILKVLQHGINNPKYQSLQYSGIKVEYDPLLPPDKRIVEVTLPDGSALNAEKTYRVVTNDFMAEGGDGYAMFKEGSSVIDTHRLVREVLIEAIKKIKTIDFKGDNRYSGTGAKGEQQIPLTKAA
ncbi:MAG: 5'-nucleotidase C-terminal domain-containing protein [Syntrophomonas sp.]|nr:5'-nucleotidase C-terminal domain-containing protein [Syntrophomonas sp.]